MKLEITDVKATEEQRILKTYLTAVPLTPSPMEFELPIDNGVLARLRLAMQLSNPGDLKHTVVTTVSTTPFQSLEAEICIPGIFIDRIDFGEAPLHIAAFRTDKITLTTFDGYSLYYSYKCSFECLLSLQLLLGEHFKNAMFFVEEDEKLHTKMCFPLCDVIKITDASC